MIFIKFLESENQIGQILSKLFSEDILSVIVEGGLYLIESFINANLWDEAHIFTGNKFFSDGIKAPKIKGALVGSEQLDNDQLFILKNQH